MTIQTININNNFHMMTFLSKLGRLKKNSLENCLARQFAQLFLLVCGGVSVVTISPRKAKRKISVMFDIFGLERQIPHRVR